MSNRDYELLGKMNSVGVLFNKHSTVSTVQKTIHHTMAQNKKNKKGLK
jgi:hypothetical protein